MTDWLDAVAERETKIVASQERFVPLTVAERDRLVKAARALLVAQASCNHEWRKRVCVFCAKGEAP